MARCPRPLVHALLASKASYRSAHTRTYASHHRKCGWLNGGFLYGSRSLASKERQRAAPWGLGHITHPRVRGREEACPPSEAAVRVGEGGDPHTTISSRVCGKPSQSAIMLTLVNPSWSASEGQSSSPSRLRVPTFLFCANPRGNRSGIGFPAPWGGATPMEGVGFCHWR